jgi:hypothetical protein
MSQLITIFLCVSILLLVPAGIVQVHTVLQMRAELQELTYAATKFVSNRGGTGDEEVFEATHHFILQELESKAYFMEQPFTLSIHRTIIHDPAVWSHEDEFHLEMRFPTPRFLSLISFPSDVLTVSKTGTINQMNYDLVGGY